MNTPICDFVKAYARSGGVRMHMPGHKGASFLGYEACDLTEIGGADNLYAPEGIIRESERNAAGLFGTGETLYSTEGSSQCIRAMLYLAVLAFLEKNPGKRPTVIAGRNAHKAFLTAALLDFDIVWLWPENETYSLCRCDLSGRQLEQALGAAENAAAVYITSPDYLGNCADIPALAEAAHKKNVPLLVDNAHGAYRRFLEPPCHPIGQGADLCCDSAHKTLPVLTGGAYLHIAEGAPDLFFDRARGAMAMFGSTSPSYLILQSLDLANRYLAEGYRERLGGLVRRVGALKARLADRGWAFAGDEPVKLTLNTRTYGYTGEQVGAALEAQEIVYEYADPDYIVLMPTPENSESDLRRLEGALLRLDKRPALGGPPAFERPVRVMPVRQAMFRPWVRVPVEEAAGRTVASLTAMCPPAVAPAVPGERVEAGTAAVYRYYGIEELSVLQE